MPGGGSFADHQAAAARARGQPIPKGPEPPPEAVHIWNAFMALHLARSASDLGPNPLGWAEIDAWCRLTRTRLDPWEAEAIRALDDAYLASRIPAGKPRPEEGKG
ncbi:hypothetical protein [Rubellimicrobium sp. CFH 75288]|uniref:phage tail assembly chaperone n=1 Tax=Rubellimicrobium sp. CFH 75288 TaxID=2697034 RepID=UPI001412402B|nr:hypothetical protein [Rubellimicrobium sp. CFH 75288]NAZ37146.1 hypothetical protein [Rubellimicrobium sp. CFH 75288]